VGRAGGASGDVDEAHLKILGGVAGELENLGGEVLCGAREREREVSDRTSDNPLGSNDSRTVDGRFEGTRRRRARAGRRGDVPRMAAEYTAAVAPTRPPEAARF